MDKRAAVATDPRRLFVVTLRTVTALFLLVGPAALVVANDAENLRSADEKTRYNTARALGAAKSVDPALTPILVERVREDSALAVRWAAALALGKVQPTQKLALAALAEVVADADEVIGVRRAAAESLGRTGSRPRTTPFSVKNSAHRGTCIKRRTSILFCLPCSISWASAS